jgi:hypothetical protein
MASYMEENSISKENPLAEEIRKWSNRREIGK